MSELSLTLSEWTEAMETYGANAVARITARRAADIVAFRFAEDGDRVVGTGGVIFIYDASQCRLTCKYFILRPLPKKHVLHVPLDQIDHVTIFPFRASVLLVDKHASECEGMLAELARLGITITEVPE